MLKALKIQNLILIDQIELKFTDGLNIITGESGAGKSALLSAIDLALGKKADFSLIQQGKDFCFIEATFSLPKSQKLLELFAKNDLTLDSLDEIEIRRELHQSGKSRCLINAQLIPLKTLQEISCYLIEKIDQHHAYHLRDPSLQLEELDEFILASNLKDQLKKTFVKIEMLQKELDELDTTYSERQKQKDLENLEKLIKANFNPEEEKTLTQEHHLLSHNQELLQTMQTIFNSIENLELFQKAYLELSHLEKIDPKLIEPKKMLHEISLIIEELKHFFRSYLAKLDLDPHHFEAIENRLALIESMKKELHLPFDELVKMKDSLRDRIAKSDQIEQKRAFILDEKEAFLSKQEQAAEELSQFRKKGAKKLEELITDEVHQLNMIHGKFEIAFSEKSLTLQGKDQIEFLFKPNPGGNLLSLKDYASGGEVSRIMLSLKCALAKNNRETSLVFDEIDANVGGETANKIGQKLKELSQNRQIFCVTHFVQVAKYADTHYSVYKKESTDSAVTLIQKLSKQAQKQELARMIGLIPENPS